MGFYGKEPFSSAKATYVWTGLGSPGYFHVEVQGDAPNYSYGFQLKRDAEFVGGLKVDVMGWTGPIGEGTTPYSVTGTFPGEFREKIVISGSNKTEVIEVDQVPHTDIEDWIRKKAA
ncbi:MAG: hypothetical protein B7733_03985 [Myxococcales bacterium FL481]|nr:MAG: hypothetical protein B7733_03985 [Myxococcales bacterium FL481]